MQITLNEASLGGVSSEQHARTVRSKLLRTLRSAFAVQGVERGVRTIEGIDSIELYSGYPLKRWRNDPIVDADERTLFRSISSFLPLIDQSERELVDLFDRYLFFHNETPVFGLGAAYLTESLAVSCETGPGWRSSQVSITALYEQGNETNETVASVCHASTPAHVAEHSAALSERFNSSIRSGADLWEHRAQLFPQLKFGTDVKKSLLGEIISGPRLEQILLKLQRLNSAAHSWTSGAFGHADIGMKVTPESRSTMQATPEDHTFHCEDRKEDVLFTWHCRLTPGAWRLYYEAIRPGLLSVGYIGPKMSTSKTKV